MASDGETRWSSGRLSGDSEYRPPIRVDCSDWTAPDWPAEGWSHGQLAGASDYRTPTPVDASGWLAGPVPVLEVTLGFTADADPAAAFAHALAFVDALDRLELGLGGAGLRHDPARPAAAGRGGSFAMTANDPHGAEARLAEVAGQVEREAAALPGVAAAGVRLYSRAA